jgi:hypothetical protein
VTGSQHSCEALAEAIENITRFSMLTVNADDCQLDVAWQSFNEQFQWPPKAVG